MTAGVNRRTSLALVVCCCAAASSIHGQGQTTVPGARISIPARHAAAAMLKAVSGQVIVIGRGGGPMPDINDHTIAVLNRNGEEIFARAPGRDIAYARTVVLEDATITADGNLFVSVQAWDARATPAAALIHYDIRAGTMRKVIRTTPALCLKIAAAQNGDVWCFGPDVEKENNRRKDYVLLWRLSVSGELHSTGWPRNQFPDRPNPWSGSSSLAITNDGVAVWLSAIDMLLEWSPVSERATAIAPPARAARDKEDVVIFPAGDALTLVTVRVGDGSRAALRRGLFLLDQRRSGWARQASEFELPIGIWAIGTDAERLVLWDRYQRQLIWTPRPY